jgi:type VI protein secretion system component VasK
VLPVGVVAWGAKLVLIWSGGLATLIADLTVFNTNSLFGAMGAMVIIVGTAVLTVRSNAIRFWKDEAEAARARAERTETERDEQRALKHEVKSELAAERKLRDLTPILRQLAENQRNDAALVAAVEALAETQKGIEARLETNNKVLERVAAFLEKTTTEGAT